jgi:predicted nucleic acid-binding protein
LFFLPLHKLEVECGIRQRAFFRRHSGAQNKIVLQERDSALARLRGFLARQAFQEVTPDNDQAFKLAAELARQHAERIGARSIDLLHVASALDLQTELFLTTDRRQSQIAKAEGLKVRFVK